MGRYSTYRPLELSRGRPNGPRWSQYTAQLWAGWLRHETPCWYCGHGFTVRGETAHLISPIVAPALSWSRENLVPSHGRAGRRCPEPSCNLNCNWLAHNSPDAPKDENGRDLPFTPQFLARQAAERAQFLAKRQKQALFRPQVPVIPRRNGDQPIVPFRKISPGREW